MPDWPSPGLRRLVAKATRRSRATRSDTQERLRFALEGTNDGLWDLQLPGGSVYLSPRGCEILGFRPDELPRGEAAWDQLVHPDDLPASQAALDAYLDGRAPVFEVEFRLRTASGAWKWVAARGKAVERDPSGAPIRMVGTYTDISVRKRAEEELRASEERLRLAVDVADLGLYELNVQTGESTVNQQYARMLGYDPAGFHLSTEEWIEQLHPDERDVVAATYRDFVAGKLPDYRVEFRQRTRSGGWKWIASLARAVERDAQGAPLRIVGMHTDISERKHAEEQLRAAAAEASRLLEDEVRSRRTLLSILEDQKATEVTLRESEARFRAVAESANDGILTTDSAGVIVAWNRGAERIFGYTVAEVVGQPLTALIPEQQRDVHRREMGRVLAGEMPPLDGSVTQVRGLHKDRSEFPLEISLSSWEVGGRRFYTGIVRDITDRTRAEEALARSESSYRDLVRHTPVAIFVNRDNRVALVNDACLRLFGAQREEDLLGKSPFELFHPDDHARIRERIDSLRDTGDVVGPTEEHIVRMDGRPVDVDVTVSLFEDQGTGAIHVVLSDIMERKRAERALIQERALLESLMDNSPDRIYFKDANSRFVLVNKAQAAAFGLSDPLQAVGKTDSDFLGDEEARAGIENEQEIMRTGLPMVGWEESETGADGRQAWLSTTKLSRTDLEGNVVGTFGISRDITERKRAEEVLQAERDRAQRYLDIAGAILVGIAPDRTIVLINKSGCALLGYSQEELLGRDWFDLAVPEGERDLVRAEFARLMSGDLEPPGFFENSVVARNGDLRIVSWHNALLRDAAGAMVGTLSSGEDITERKRAEAEISRLNAELEQRVVERTAELQAANKDLEAFSYSVSHDLRAPLRAISGFASILDRRCRNDLDETGRHYLDTIMDASDHMGVLIEELLDYSRFGRRAVRLEPVPLGPLVAALRATFGEQIAATGGTLDVIEPLVTPIGDPMLLERILSNLVGNALTYHHPDVAPHVTLSAARHGHSVTLAIADNGIGIPAEYRERIFEVFARLHTDEEYPGTGIGLSIARKAARLMGSEVALESTEGVGSTFRLDLPAAQDRSTPS